MVSTVFRSDRGTMVPELLSKDGDIILVSEAVGWNRDEIALGGPAWKSFYLYNQERKTFTRLETQDIRGDVTILPCKKSLLSR